MIDYQRDTHKLLSLQSSCCFAANCSTPTEPVQWLPHLLAVPLLVLLLLLLSGISRGNLLSLGGAVDLETLAEPIGNGAFASSGALGEGGGATEGAGSSTVANTDDADVFGTADLALASHALGHLDLDGELGVGGQGKAPNTQSGNILGDLGVLEGFGVGAARGSINGGGKRTSAVLVDLRASCQRGVQAS